MTDNEVAEVLGRYGAGQLTATETAERIRPAYGEALAEHATRRADLIDGIWPRDPDAASVPNAFTEVALARNLRVITMRQYSELVDALP